MSIQENLKRAINVSYLTYTPPLHKINRIYIKHYKMLYKVFFEIVFNIIYNFWQLYQ